MLWYYLRSSHYKNWLFESPPLAGFQITNFGVSSAFGAGNTKIGFIMRIAVLLAYSIFWSNPCLLWFSLCLRQKENHKSILGFYVLGHLATAIFRRRVNAHLQDAVVLISINGINTPFWICPLVLSSL